MIIYLVTRSCEDDFHINKAFLHKHMAEKWLDVMKTRNEIYDAWHFNRGNLFNIVRDRYSDFNSDILRQIDAEVDKVLPWEAEPFGGEDMDHNPIWSIRELEVEE